jgi:hypothetical protein
MQMCGCADEIQLNVHNKRFDPTYFASPILRSHIGTSAHRHIGTRPFGSGRHRHIGVVAAKLQRK